MKTFIETATRIKQIKMVLKEMEEVECDIVKDELEQELDGLVTMIDDVLHDIMYEALNGEK